MVPTDQVEEVIQNAQDELQSLQNELDEHSPLTERAEDRLEAVEDAVDTFEESETEEERSDARASAEAGIQEAQDALDDFQEEVGYDNANLAEQIEVVEDRLEAVEDSLTDTPGKVPDEPGDLVVEVNEEEKDAPERHMTPLEIVRLFDYDPDNVVLYKARDIENDGSQEGDQYLPRDEEIDLYGLNRFACLPSETPYGAAAEDSLDTIENEALVKDIKRLREEYEVDIQQEGNFTQAIVRNWSIPSDAYSKDQTDVMIRVPQGYPQQHPDWVYVDEDLRLADGGMPKKHNRDRVNGWLALSWHVNNLNDVSWVPYETDLKWYLDTFCDHRLRQGE